MQESRPKRPTLRYGQDIVIDDVERLNSFLTERTAGPARAERGSEERHMARSIRAAQLHLVVTLQHSLSFPHVGSGAQEIVRWKIRLSWNALWTLSSPWQWHDEYDQERWRPIKYWDKSHEEDFEERLVGEAGRRNGGPSGAVEE